jgi:hypothetical protein
VGAKISLADEVELSLLLAGFFEEPKVAPAAKAEKAPEKAPAKATAKPDKK